MSLHFADIIPDGLQNGLGEFGAVAGSLAAIAALILLFPRIWGWVGARRRHEMEVAARAATDALLATLMAPNGGKSLADISVAVGSLHDEQTALRADVRGLGQRMGRVENQVDTILLPKQATIYDDVKALRRGKDDG